MVFLKLIHVAACIALIIIVLLQADKGEGLSGAFGSGGSGALFGKRGANSFFAKTTATAAVIFMVTSFWLGFKGTSIFKSAGGHSAPIDTSNFPVQ